MPAVEAQGSKDRSKTVTNVSNKAFFCINQSDRALVNTIACQEPHNHAAQEDDGTSFFQEAGYTLPGMQQNVFSSRQMVRRQLHNERSRVTGEQLSLFQNDAGGDDSEEANEVHNRCHIPVAAHDSAGKQCNNRKLSAAGNEGRGHDGQTTVLLIFNSTAGHDARNAAAGGNQQRNEALAAHAELTEETVHDEGHTSHIAAVLKEAQHQEDDSHLRSKANRCANAADDTINNKRYQPILTFSSLHVLLHPRLNPFAKQRIIRKVSYDSTHSIDCDVVNKEHNDSKNRQSQETVRNNAVDFIRNCQAGLTFDNCFAHQLANVVITLIGNNAFGIIVHSLLAGSDDFFNLRLLAFTKAESSSNFLVALKQLYQQPAFACAVNLVASLTSDSCQCSFNLTAEAHIFRSSAANSTDSLFCSLTGAFALQRRGFYDSAAQLCRQLLSINLIAILADDINHVQGNGYRIAHFHNLRSQIQVTFDVRAIDQIQHAVNIILQQIVAGYNLLQSVRRQGVNTRQVSDNYIIMTFQAAFFFLYSYAGPVANILVGAGQIIKHCCFAAVRVTNQGNLYLLHLRPPLILQRYAQLRRYAASAHSRAP